MRASSYPMSGYSATIILTTGLISRPTYLTTPPWFFNGVRIQWFPTNELQIEPWVINGRQPYGKFNTNPGLGGQILYMPKEWLKLVFNQYGFGEDNVGLPHTQRVHTDDSIGVR